MTAATSCVKPLPRRWPCSRWLVAAAGCAAVAVAVASVGTFLAAPTPNFCVEFADASLFEEVPRAAPDAVGDARAAEGARSTMAYPRGLGAASRHRLFRVHPQHAGGGGVADAGALPLPLLFLHGHRGERDQASALATVLAALCAQQADVRRCFAVYTLDWRAADSAFGRHVLLAQAAAVNAAAQRLLALHRGAGGRAAHVVIVAHSMGGIAARLALQMPNHVAGTLGTIITLNSPHQQHPVPADSDIWAMYAMMARDWAAAAAIDAAPAGAGSASAGLAPAARAIATVALVSVTGGAADSLVRPDQCDTTGLTPPARGFTVATQAVPRAWLQCDHDGIVNCGQVIAALAAALHDAAPLLTLAPAEAAARFGGVEGAGGTPRLDDVMGNEEWHGRRLVATAVTSVLRARLTDEDAMRALATAPAADSRGALPSQTLSSLWQLACNSSAGMCDGSSGDEGAPLICVPIAGGAGRSSHASARIFARMRPVALVTAAGADNPLAAAVPLADLCTSASPCATTRLDGGAPGPRVAALPHSAPAPHLHATWDRTAAFLRRHASDDSVGDSREPSLRFRVPSPLVWLPVAALHSLTRAWATITNAAVASIMRRPWMRAQDSAAGSGSGGDGVVEAAGLVALIRAVAPRAVDESTSNAASHDHRVERDVQRAWQRAYDDAHDAVWVVAGEGEAGSAVGGSTHVCHAASAGPDEAQAAPLWAFTDDANAGMPAPRETAPGVWHIPAGRSAAVAVPLPQPSSHLLLYGVSVAQLAVPGGACDQRLPPILHVDGGGHGEAFFVRPITVGGEATTYPHSTHFSFSLHAASMDGGVPPRLLLLLDPACAYQATVTADVSHVLVQLVHHHLSWLLTSLLAMALFLVAVQVRSLEGGAMASDGGSSAPTAHLARHLPWLLAVCGLAAVVQTWVVPVILSYAPAHLTLSSPAARPVLWAPPSFADALAANVLALAAVCACSLIVEGIAAAARAAAAAGGRSDRSPPPSPGSLQAGKGETVSTNDAADAKAAGDMRSPTRLLIAVPRAAAYPWHVDGGQHPNEGGPASVLSSPGSHVQASFDGASPQPAAFGSDVFTPLLAPGVSTPAPPHLAAMALSLGPLAAPSSGASTPSARHLRQTGPGSLALHIAPGAAPTTFAMLSSGSASSPWAVHSGGPAGGGTPVSRGPSAAPAASLLPASTTAIAPHLTLGIARSRSALDLAAPAANGSATPSLPGHGTPVAGAGAAAAAPPPAGAASATLGTGGTGSSDGAGARRVTLNAGARSRAPLARHLHALAELICHPVATWLQRRLPWWQRHGGAAGRGERAAHRKRKTSHWDEAAIVDGDSGFSDSEAEASSSKADGGGKGSSPSPTMQGQGDAGNAVPAIACMTWSACGATDTGCSAVNQDGRESAWVRQGDGCHRRACMLLSARRVAPEMLPAVVAAAFVLPLLLWLPWLVVAMAYGALVMRTVWEVAGARGGTSYRTMRPGWGRAHSAAAVWALVTVTLLYALVLAIRFMAIITAVNTLSEVLAAAASTAGTAAIAEAEGLIGVASDWWAAAPIVAHMAFLTVVPGTTIAASTARGIGIPLPTCCSAQRRPHLHLRYSAIVAAIGWAAAALAFTRLFRLAACISLFAGASVVALAAGWRESAGGAVAQPAGVQRGVATGVVVVV